MGDQRSSSDDRAMRNRVLTIPNILTFARLLLVPFFVIASLTAHYNSAFVVFVTAGITDAFDGYIARRLNQKSWLGAILDPAADKTMMFSGYVLYTFIAAVPHRLPPRLTFTLFARDVLIVIFAYLLYTRIQIRRFPPSVAGKVTTVFQVITLSAVIAANTVIHPVASWLLIFVVPATAVLTVYSGWDYLRRGEVMFRRAVEADEMASLADTV